MQLIAASGDSAGNGRVTVGVRNSDLFWHTFTIDAAGVDVAVPVGAVRQAAFDAAPGSYTFYCKIPGHAQAGMRGTLTVGSLQTDGNPSTCSGVAIPKPVAA